jgi:hypothetical protein
VVDVLLGYNLASLPNVDNKNTEIVSNVVNTAGHNAPDGLFNKLSTEALSEILVQVFNGLRHCGGLDASGIYG